jgi:hypothetical protein
MPGRRAAHPEIRVVERRARRGCSEPVPSATRGRTRTLTGARRRPFHPQAASARVPLGPAGHCAAACWTHQGRRRRMVRGRRAGRSAVRLRRLETTPRRLACRQGPGGRGCRTIHREPVSARAQVGRPACHSEATWAARRSPDPARAAAWILPPCPLAHRMSGHPEVRCRSTHSPARRGWTLHGSLRRARPAVAPGSVGARPPHASPRRCPDRAWRAARPCGSQDPVDATAAAQRARSGTRRAAVCDRSAGSPARAPDSEPRAPPAAGYVVPGQQGPHRRTDSPILPEPPSVATERWGGPTAKRPRARSRCPWPADARSIPEPPSDLRVRRRAGSPTASHGARAIGPARSAARRDPGIARAR